MMSCTNTNTILLLFSLVAYVILLGSSGSIGATYPKANAATTGFRFQSTSFLFFFLPRRAAANSSHTAASVSAATVAVAAASKNKNSTTPPAAVAPSSLAATNQNQDPPTRTINQQTQTQNHPATIAGNNKNEKHEKETLVERNHPLSVQHEQQQTDTSSSSSSSFSNQETRTCVNPNDEFSHSEPLHLVDNILAVLEEEEEEEADEEDPTKAAARRPSKKQLFLDKIALVSSALLKREPDAPLHDSEHEHEHEQNLNAITPQSDLTLPGRYIHVVTTAALPWMTGTAVNPLLRAAHLHRRLQEINSNHDGRGGSSNSNNSTTTTHKQWVTLVIPWLELPEDQMEVYQKTFATPQEQEVYIRAWLRDQAGMEDVAHAVTGLKMVFYPARYHSGMRSVFAMGDIISLLPPEELDVCILEEPEVC
jgi:hypothetical protein